jgi:hypothetical protein
LYFGWLQIIRLRDLSLLVPGVGWITMVVMLLLVGQFPSIMVAFITKTVKVSTFNFSS